MKKFLAFGFGIFLTLTLVGCSTESSTTETSTNTENIELTTSVEKALEERWKITDDTETEESTMTLARKGIEKEIELLEPQLSKLNKDSSNYIWLDRYLLNLQSGLTALDIISVRNTEDWSEWDKHQEDRYALLAEYNERSKITVSSSNKEYLDKMIAEGDLINQKNKQILEVAEKLKKQVSELETLRYSGDNIIVTYSSVAPLSMNQMVNSFRDDSLKVIEEVKTMDFNEIAFVRPSLTDSSATEINAIIYVSDADSLELIDEDTDVEKFFNSAVAYRIHNSVYEKLDSELKNDFTTLKSPKSTNQLFNELSSSY